MMLQVLGEFLTFHSIPERFVIYRLFLVITIMVMRLLETAVLAVVQILVPSLQFLIVKRKVLPTQILLQIGMLVNSWNIQ